MMWLFYSLLTVILWGLWSFLAKLASNHLKWYELYVLSSSVALWFSLALVLLYGMNPTITGVSLGVLTGLLGALGYITFILAVKYGQVSVVVPLTAVYPAVAFALGFIFLREKLTLNHLLGLILTLAGVYLLSR